jgi:hypothetical protein
VIGLVASACSGGARHDWSRHDALSSESALTATSPSLRLDLQLTSSEPVQDLVCLVDTEIDEPVDVTFGPTGLTYHRPADGGPYLRTLSSKDTTGDGTSWELMSAVDCRRAPCIQSYLLVVELPADASAARVSWVCSGTMSGVGDAPPDASIALRRL